MKCINVLNVINTFINVKCINFQLMVFSNYGLIGT